MFPQPKSSFPLLPLTWRWQHFCPKSCSPDLLSKWNTDECQVPHCSYPGREQPARSSAASSLRRAARKQFSQFSLCQQAAPRVPTSLIPSSRSLHSVIPFLGWTWESRGRWDGEHRAPAMWFLGKPRARGSGQGLMLKWCGITRGSVRIHPLENVLGAAWLWRGNGSQGQQSSFDGNEPESTAPSFKTPRPSPKSVSQGDIPRRRARLFFPHNTALAKRLRFSLHPQKSTICLGLPGTA